MEKLRDDIKNNTFENVYLLFGEESYLVRSYKNQMKKAISGDDTMNCSCYEGKDISYEEISETARTLPFFAEHRLIILEHTGFFKSAATDDWINLVKELPESCILIFAEYEVDKRGRLYRAVKEKGYCAELARQSENSLKRWVTGGLKREGLKITEEALDLFLSKTGNDMENIRMELEKLSGYCYGKEGVSAKDVEEICTQKLENRVFEMIRMAADGKSQKALELYYDLLALKEPGLRILVLIARQMNQLLIVKEMALSRATKDEMAKQLGVHSYVITKLMGQARQYTLKQLHVCLEECLQAEEAVKSGTMSDQIAMEILLMKIASKRIDTKNENVS